MEVLTETMVDSSENRAGSVMGKNTSYRDPADRLQHGF